MTLFAYRQQTQRLLGDVIQARMNPSDLDSYINTARFQAAAEGEAIRTVGTIPTVGSQQSYLFSAITASGTGYGSVLAVRLVSSGGVLLQARNWEWFYSYYIAPGTTTGTPTVWSQLGQGVSGSFYLAPTPSGIVTLTLDCVLLPINLVDDTTAEALPYPFTDAVPYFAAYLALLSANEGPAAQSMYQSYERFMMRARSQATPSVLPEQYFGGEGAKLAGTNTPIINPATLGGGAPARGA